MKKFAQTAILIAGLAGLSACAASQADTYGDRTAGDGGERAYVATSNGEAGDVQTLQMCLERENRLLEMNRSCYRK